MQVLFKRAPRECWKPATPPTECVATDRSGHKYGSVNGNYYGSLNDAGTTPEGFGTLRSHGDEFTGEFKDGKPHGYGEMRYRSGALHQGYWVDGVPEGYGRYVDAAGHCIHDGRFHQGLPKENYNFAQSARVNLAVRKFIRNLG